MARVIAFDVNETLLDLRALDPDFAHIFGEAAARREWFSQMLQSALVATVTGVYTDFGSTGIAALEMLAERRGIILREADRQRIREGMQRLPPYPEVRATLERLRDAGLRMVTLTNSTEAVATAQIINAGLRVLFEEVFSADSVQRLKPAPEPYRMAAARLGVPIDQVRLVAAHSWDIAGALRAGCAAAFVARPGMVLDPLVERPDIVGTDLRAIADQIIAVECE
jgi:2-haloacid dehalogenase